MITTKVTSGGIYYEIDNLSMSGYQYFWIDLMGDREYEIEQASCQITSTEGFYAHYGRLFLQWESFGDHIIEHELDSGYFTYLDPFTIKRTHRVSGPVRLMFRTFLDGNYKAWFTAFIRIVSKEKGGGVRWW